MEALSNAVAGLVLPSHASVADFEYPPLPEGHLRLIDLEWSEGDESPHVTLSTSPMASHPSFEALSYAWGDPEITSPILCNGGTLHLSWNLNAALHRIISPGEMKKKLWIDQICINQNDNIEKSVQVRLMGKIFGRAKRVIVWLGDAPPTAKPGFNSLSSLQDALKDLVRRGQNFENFGEDRLEEFGLPNKFHAVWGVLWEVFDSSWFRRLWVMQEATLARNLRLFYGSNSMDWDFIKDFARVIRDVISVYRMNPYTTLTSRQDAFYNLEIIRHLRECRETDSPITLSDLLEFSSGKSCALEQDKIYALFGILKDEEQDKLEIDYSKPIQQIHLEAFKVGIETDETLSLLNLPFAKDRSIGLPSWCPVLSSRIEAFRLRRYLYSAACLDGYRQSFSQQIPHSPPHFEPNSGNLKLQGLYLGKVEEVITTRHPSRDVYEEEGVDAYNEQSRIFEGACCDLAASTLKGEERESMEPHWRTLTANAKSFQGGRADADMGRAYTLWRKALRENKINEIEAGVWFEFHGAMLNACAGRRYFSTDDGRLGVGPEEIRSSDMVVVFLGGHTPFVIRSNTGKRTSTFMGECYVHGLMDGEALDMLDRRELKVEEFVLD